MRNIKCRQAVLFRGFVTPQPSRLETEKARAGRFARRTNFKTRNRKNAKNFRQRKCRAKTLNPKNRKCTNPIPISPTSFGCGTEWAPHHKSQSGKRSIAQRRRHKFGICNGSLTPNLAAANGQDQHPRADKQGSHTRKPAQEPQKTETHEIPGKNPHKTEHKKHYRTLEMGVFWGPALWLGLRRADFGWRCPGGHAGFRVESEAAK